jgi:hypothetical protein
VGVLLVLSPQLIEQVCVCTDASVKVAETVAFVLPPIGIGFDEVVPVMAGGVLPGPQPLHTGSGLPLVQVPPWQVSLRVHASPSLQVDPLALAGLEQRPVDGAQTPASWHWSDAVQTVAVPGVQTPAWHESLLVHKSPSLQADPLVLIGLEQRPVDGAQTPTSWHWSEAVQVTLAQRSSILYVTTASFQNPDPLIVPLNSYWRIAGGDGFRYQNLRVPSCVGDGVYPGV